MTQKSATAVPRKKLLPTKVPSGEIVGLLYSNSMNLARLNLLAIEVSEKQAPLYHPAARIIHPSPEPSVMEALRLRSRLARFTDECRPIIQQIYSPLSKALVSQGKTKCLGFLTSQS